MDPVVRSIWAKELVRSMRPTVFKWVFKLAELRQIAEEQHRKAYRKRGVS